MATNKGLPNSDGEQDVLIAQALALMNDALGLLDLTDQGEPACYLSLAIDMLRERKSNASQLESDAEKLLEANPQR